MSDMRDFTIMLNNGTIVPLRGFVRSFGAADCGTRYGKPRISPKLPRKLKKALRRSVEVGFYLDIASLEADAGMIRSASTP